jgi:transposase, IS5 family
MAIHDENSEYQVNARLSFMPFLGLDLNSDMPDATTVWLFRKQLREAGLVRNQLIEVPISDRLIQHP